MTFRFDDGWASQFDTALPMLDAAGIKGTFYIVTHQLLDDGFSGFISKAQVLQMAADGEEIAAHTRTHPHLNSLSTTQQQQEIDGSKSDLESWGLHPTSFSYPYGEYSQNTVQLVKDAGFSSAVTTVETPVSPSSDPLQLQGTSYQVTDSPQKIEQDIQNAVANHQWMILTFHRIDTSGDQYSITPDNFKTVVDYVKSHNIRTVTVSEGAAQLSK